MTANRELAAVPSALSAVTLVAAREIRARVANRSFVTGTLVSVAIILGLLFIFAPASGEEERPTVAVTGASVASLESLTGQPDGVAWRATADENAAREQLANRRADAALVVRGNQADLVVRDAISTHARNRVTAAAQRWAVTRALQMQQVDLQRLQRDTATAMPRIKSAGGGALGSAELGTAVGVVSLLFFQLFGYGLMVAQGVVEEKSTRVVEILLSTLTPLRLMVGKVFGIGIAAVIQMAALGAAVIGAVRFGHVLPATFPTAPTIVSAVAWFFLGFLFFAFLFAAAGSLVSRAEEVGSAVMPVLLATMAPFGVAIMAAQDPNASWVQAVRYVPPFSMLVMPLEVSVHRVGWDVQAAAALLMVAATVGLAVVTGRVYERSILRVGGQVRWREALGKAA